MTRAASILAIAFFAISFMPPLWACTCGWVSLDGVGDQPPPLEMREFRGYEAVFTGTVIRLELEEFPQPTETCSECSIMETVATFEVSESWSEQLGSTFSVRTKYWTPSCGYEFRLGRSYLVFAERQSRKNRYHVEQCSRTTAFPQAKAAREELVRVAGEPLGAKP